MDRLKLKILGLETNGCAVKFGLGNYYTKDYLTVHPLVSNPRILSLSLSIVVYTFLLHFYYTARRHPM